MPLEASLPGCVGVFDSNADRSELLELSNTDVSLIVLGCRRCDLK